MVENLPDTNVGNIEYISKQDAITAACKGLCHPGARCPDEPCREQTKYLRDLPAADVAPVRHGKWIFVHPLSSDDGGAYLCSECEKGDWDIKPSDKFCKFCGAKMDRKEEEEE